jgi:hypothetical protein
MARRFALSLALFVALAIPAACRAEYVIFRNECRGSIVVQTATVVRGVLKRDQALVKPGEYTGKIPLDSDKIITFCDGRTGKILFRDPLRATKKPLAFGILPGANGKVRVEKRMMPTEKPPE